MKKRRIAYYLVTSGFGGMELAALASLRQLDRQAFEPVMYLRCTGPEADARLRGELAGLGVPVRELNEDGLPLQSRDRFRFPVGQQEEKGNDPGAVEKGSCSLFSLKRVARAAMPRTVRSAWYSWEAVRAAAQVFRREAFNAIHFLHGWYPSEELPVIASWTAGIPVRISDVWLEPERAWPKQPIHRFLIRRAAASATRVRAMYPRMKARLVSEFRIPPERITVVPFWVDVEPFAQADGATRFRAELGILPRCRVVTVPARLSKEKGHTVLLEAIAKLDGTARDVRFLLVGDGPLREELQRQVAAKGLADRVTFLGFRADIPAILSASDLVVLSSFTEGIPGALLEAMAAGKPIVATEVGGVGELFRHGEIGRLVQPGDPEALRQAIGELLAMGGAALQQMGANGRSVVRQHYARQELVRRMVALYDQEPCS